MVVVNTSVVSICVYQGLALLYFHTFYVHIVLEVFVIISYVSYIVFVSAPFLLVIMIMLGSQVLLMSILLSVA